VDIKEKIKKLPLTSGVYLMKSVSGEILYVGKAVSLRKRVQSYFHKSKGLLSKTDFESVEKNFQHSHPERKRGISAETKDIEIIPTNSEAEALILEASLIKKYKPRYNIDLRDDKMYPFIEITNEKFPLVRIVRPRDEEFKKRKKSKFYGPYVRASLIREAMQIFRRVFPFRTCNPLPKKECLDYHIGLCDAPCIKNITVRKYAKNIRNIRYILEGKKDALYKSLKKEMEDLAKDRSFENAAETRDQIRAIGSLYSGTKDVNHYKETEQLQRALGLPKRPERIEAFDISNIMGKESVGSMVSFLNGKPDKNNYRKFKIREVEGIDDPKMIAEIVKRRYRRLKNTGSAFPDLIVIDGGKGQLSSAKRELDNLEVEIPVISIAKREEEIFIPRRRFAIILPKDSLGLKLIQRIRDEAHRFAISYHRKLRSKNTFKKK